MQKIGLYIHWPYCTRICPYCDFNIYKNKPDMEQNLISAILADMKYWRGQSGPRRLASIHFGGGTPSLMHPENVQIIIERAKNLWATDSDLEVGMEANPNDISKSILKAWRGAGVERVSIGVQSFSDKALNFLGRDHDKKQAKAALYEAAQIMPRVSADLIYGWVGQDIAIWDKDLRQTLGLGVGHISAYQLTIEARTAFAKAQARGEGRVVDTDTSADLYEHGLQVIKQCGFSQYEVSNYAKTKTDRSRHNLLYWQGEDYIGVGPGAHGRLTSNMRRKANICTKRPNDYREHVEKYGHGSHEIENLSRSDWAQEYVLMGLRINEGISLARYIEISGHALNPQAIKHYVSTGLLAVKQGRLFATDHGRLVLDSLSHELLFLEYV
ncbi:MAG: radical SAM family heme chaperone HemW [Robiginitomaculum sp.]